MKTKSLLSKVLCVLMLCTGYVIYGCTEGPIDKGDGTEQEGDKNGNEEGNGKEDEGYEDMGTAAYRIDEFTATTATFTGHLKVPASELQFFSQVTVYYTSDDVFNFDTAESVSTTSFGPDQDFKVVLKELLFDTKYKYCILTDVKSGKTYSKVSEFSTAEVNSEVSVTSVTATTASFRGKVTNLSEKELSTFVVGVLYSTEQGAVSQGKGTKRAATEIAPDGSFSVEVSNLKFDNKYFYCTFVKQGEKYLYSTEKELITEVEINCTVASVTATTASFCGKVTSLSEKELSSLVVGVLYSTEQGVVSQGKGTELAATEIAPDGSFTLTGSNLNLGTKYYVSAFVKQNEKSSFSEIKEFTTNNVSCDVSVSSVTATTASFIGKVTDMSDEDRSSLGVYIHYSTIKEIVGQDGYSLQISDIASDGSFSAQISNLNYRTKYYYCSVIKSVNSKEYSSPQEFTTINPYEKDLNVSLASGFASPANCYIVSKSGLYKFRTVKGNSSESVGTVASADVLWESFGTDVAPCHCDLISGVCYKSGYIAFEISSSFREGNAVIAAKDADGNILWSWHIWLTDAPQGQTYNNNAGVMMDRNLGATSATPGDVGALGLLYQWGRKDPFLNSSSISSNTEARSTITWPSAVSSSSSTGTVAYATSHPTTFITKNDSNYDWYYPGSSSTDDTRWQSSKTIYDPCPAGWRVPDGGSSGVWSKAFGTNHSWPVFSNWDATNKGMDFSKTDNKLGSSGPIWYPASGCRRAALGGVGTFGYYWSVSPYNMKEAYHLNIYGDGSFTSESHDYRAYGYSVRCLQE